MSFSSLMRSLYYSRSALADRPISPNFRVHRRTRRDCLRPLRRLKAPRANSQEGADESPTAARHLRPAIGASPRKEGGVYHILRRPRPNPIPSDVKRPIRRGGRRGRLRAAARACAGRPRRRRRPRSARRALPASDGGRGPFRSREVRSPARRARPRPDSSRRRSRRSTWSARSGRRAELGLGGAGEQALLRRRLHRGAVGRHPQAPARQLARQVRRPPSPSGPATKRISRASSITSPETMSRRSR